MIIERITQPLTEPITLEQAKAHLNIIDSSRDQLVQQGISEARDYCEQYCNRVWAAASFSVGLDAFETTLPLPMGTTAVVQITYLDDEGIEQEIAEDGYVVNLRRRTVTAVDGWPSGTDVRVIATVGPDAGASPPEFPPPSVTAAMKLVLGDLFENREAAMVAVTRVDNPAVERLLHFYRTGIGV